MERYVMAARARADELLSLLDLGVRTYLQEWISQPGNFDFTEVIHRPSPRVLTILRQTPAQDHRWIQTKDTNPGKFYREWLAARHWALASATTLEIANDLQDVPGTKPYRRAVPLAALTASKYLDHPDEDSCLFLEMGG